MEQRRHRIPCWAEVLFPAMFSTVTYLFPVVNGLPMARARRAWEAANDSMWKQTWEIPYSLSLLLPQALPAVPGPWLAEAARGQQDTCPGEGASNFQIAQSLLHSVHPQKYLPFSTLCSTTGLSYVYSQCPAVVPSVLPLWKAGTSGEP